MKYKFENVNCNLCGAEDSELISTKGKFKLPVNVVICRKCGLSFLNPRWTKDSYLFFYQNDYDKYYRPNLIENHAAKTDNHIINRLRSVNALPSSIENILEIGSGEGLNLYSFKEVFKDLKMFAIEPSYSSQQLLRSKGVNVICEDVDLEWELPYKDKFDVVIMRHVLEHFMDPKNAMNKIRSTLTENGLLYIAVPNSLKIYHDLEKHWFRNVHTYYFNKFSLTSLMKICGFRILGLTEGDQYNKAEIYLVVQKAGKEPPSFSASHFNLQKEVYQKALRRDGNIILKVLTLLKNRLASLLNI